MAGRLTVAEEVSESSLGWMVCAIQSLVSLSLSLIETGSVADGTAPRRRSASYVTEL